MTDPTSAPRALASARTRPNAGAGREFLRGAGMLLGGFGWWRVRPGLMALGILPAAIVGILLNGALVMLAIWIAPITGFLTPFADDWSGLWVTILRIAIGTAVLGAAVLVSLTMFTALTLLIGEPFYARIWRAVERDDRGFEPDHDPGFWSGVSDAASLILRGLLAALVAFAVGLVPLVGSALGAVTGILLAAWLLADELSGRALTARGIDARERRRTLRAHRARALGFGVATQLSFLLPFGAIVTMPAAVVGSTRLAHSVHGDSDDLTASAE